MKRQSQGDKYEARVLFDMPNCDIALLTVDDDEFWVNHLVLEISSELVQLQSTVDVIGYPVGGETVCITNGVVSRIDWHEYVQSWYSNLCITVDAVSSYSSRDYDLRIYLLSLSFLLISGNKSG